MITIFGNVFVDLKGVSHGSVHKDAKNVGHLEVTHGGAARNAAHDLGVLGAACRFVSSITDDGTGQDVRKALDEIGVDISYMQMFASQGMGRWIAILDSQGDLAASVSEQPLLEWQEQALFAALPASLLDSSVIGVDVGISAQVNYTMAEACEHAKIPLYGLVGNLDVLMADPYSLRGFDTFVCNLEEASMLCGSEFRTRADAEQAAMRILEYGCRSVVVTMAEQGAVYLDARIGGVGYEPAREIAMVDSTGAGDSFFAGLIYARSQGTALPDALRFATDVAAQVIQTPGPTLVSTKSGA